MAEVALVLFGIAPPPLHVFCLFLNGLSLGMVFGLVIGFLEGRRNTELLTAALARQHIPARLTAPGTVEIRGADPDRVARIAAAASVIVLELSRHTDNLEDLFLKVGSKELS